MSKKHLKIAEKFLQKTFPKANSAFVSGSIIRGEGKEHSDLDIVLLFTKLPNAFRESFIFESIPVEVLAHDRETIHWFISNEQKNGKASLAHMITTGVVVPKATVLSKQVLACANEYLKLGPQKPSKKVLDELRYRICDILDDLRDERPKQEVMACATQLYPLLAELIFRNASQWVAGGKWIPRSLQQLDSRMAANFDHAFADAFNGKTKKLILFSEKILTEAGGPLWDGWHSDAPNKWKKKFK
ncbi:MAG: nucleotidyltransferase domain-containing protein [Pseudomonadota bacterium]